MHTPPPHYPDGRIRPGYRNRPLATETDRGVTVYRSGVYPAPNRGFVRRLANHATFAASALASAARTGPADVIVVETPPLFIAAAGIGYAPEARAAGDQRLRPLARLGDRARRAPLAARDPRGASARAPLLPDGCGDRMPD